MKPRISCGVKVDEQAGDGKEDRGNAPGGSLSMTMKRMIRRILAAATALALAVAARAGMREWTSQTGSTLVAEFVRLSGNLVELRDADGQTVSIFLHGLSAADQAYVRERLRAGMTPGPARGMEPESAARLRPVLAETFERRGAVADRLERHENLEIVRGEGVGGGRALLTRYVGYERGSERVTARIPLDAFLDEATLCFDIRFAPGFRFVRGGKLHGLGPESPISGGQPMRPEGWSARIMWGPEGAVQTYLYSQSKTGQYGDSARAPGFRFEPGRYHAVSLHVRLNDPPGATNGFAHLYIDGEPVVRHDHVAFRGVGGRQTQIQAFLFSTFHGGHTPDWAPRGEDGEFSTETAWLDNLAVYPGLHVRTEPGEP